MPARTIVIGSLNMDLVALSPRIPAPGETLIGHSFRTAPGGKGANQAVAAVRLGGHVTMVGRVGKDDFGTALITNLEDNGVDHRFVWQDESTATGVAIIVVDDIGENIIVVLSGANELLAPTDVDMAESAISQADVMLLQLESPLKTVIRAAELGQKHGVTVVLNPAPARSLPPELLALVDILVPNETETAMLSGMAVDTREDLVRAARVLRRQGVGSIILTLGSKGALLASAQETRLVPAFPVKAVDTTAAGDAFVAGFGVALAEGHTFAEAVRWGNAAGALAATRLGAQPSLPTRSELELLLR